MMKRFFIAALALAATIPAAFNVQAQDDDDIYFSKKANKKAKYEAIYASAEADSWTTDANNDWNLDDYNRRGKETSAHTEIEFTEDAPFYYEVIDEKGDTIKVPGNSKILESADANGYKIIRDTVVLVEQYHFSDLIRRFHNPFFGYYRYSPWYDVAFYDPFYWDYCYYDPWWYVTPSFGFHYGGWYGGWSYGYYTGWYGGWYSPFYSPMPHYHHYCYYDGPVYNYATGGSHRGSSRNNFGGHFAHRGGWKGDGGSSSRIASASTNRSYRADNGARVGFTNSNGNYTAGPTIRGRNTVNGRLVNSTMRSHTRDISNSSATNLGISRGGNTSTPAAGGSYSSRSHSATRYDRNGSNTQSRRSTYSSSNRGFSGPVDNSSYRRSERNYSPSQSSSSASSYSRSNNNHNSYNNGNSNYSRSSSSYSNNSSVNTRSSSSSYSSGSSSSYSGGSSSGGSYSRGGGGSHSSGSSHGRR